jgi:hypothetical protein
MRVRTGDTEQIIFQVLKQDGAPATGRSTIRLTILRKSDNQLFDFNDLTFKAGGHTTPQATMAEITTTSDGFYELVGGFNTGTITNPYADDTYLTIPSQTSGTDLLPPSGELVVGFWPDTLDVAVSTRATPTDVSVYESEPDLR